MDNLTELLFGPWGWAAFGLILLVLELVIPGTFLLWIGIASLLTATSTLLFGLGLELQLLTFAIYSVLSVFIGRKYFANLYARPEESTGINEPASRHIGKTVTVVEAIEGGRGRVKIADSPWIAEGPDLPAGTRVKIIGSDGPVVHVEAVPALPHA